MISEKVVFTLWRCGGGAYRPHNNLGIHLRMGSPLPSSRGFRRGCRAVACGGQRVNGGVKVVGLGTNHRLSLAQNPVLLAGQIAILLASCNRDVGRLRKRRQVAGQELVARQLAGIRHADEDVIAPFRAAALSSLSDSNRPYLGRARTPYPPSVSEPRSGGYSGYRGAAPPPTTAAPQLPPQKPLSFRFHFTSAVPAFCDRSPFLCRRANFLCRRANFFCRRANFLCRRRPLFERPPHPTKPRVRRPRHRK